MQLVSLHASGEIVLPQSVSHFSRRLGHSKLGTTSGLQFEDLDFVESLVWVSM